LKPFVELVASTTRATAISVLNDVGSEAIHLFAPRRLDCVRKIGAAPSTIQTDVQQVIIIIIFHTLMYVFDIYQYIFFF
jgi:hypothetical protein